VARSRSVEWAGLVTGVLFLVVAAGAACDAAGVWHLRPVLLLPVVLGGLVLASVAGAVARAVRRRAAGRRVSGGDGLR